jgi:hypothetical protein
MKVKCRGSSRYIDQNCMQCTNHKCKSMFLTAYRSWGYFRSPRMANQYHLYLEPRSWLDHSIPWRSLHYLSDGGMQYGKCSCRFYGLHGTRYQKTYQVVQIREVKWGWYRRFFIGSTVCQRLWMEFRLSCDTEQWRDSGLDWRAAEKWLLFISQRYKLWRTLSCNECSWASLVQES